MRRKLAVLAIITVLAAAVVISYSLNRTSVEAQKQILENAQILLKWEDIDIMLSRNDIASCGEENFNGVLDTSKTEPATHTYTGVQLKNILYSYNINLDGKTSVILSAADGFSVAYAADEVEKENNVYIAYMQDGSYLGSISTGGRGPFESIILSDVFSNRRCKWLTKIEVRQ
ncbi:MAG: molybdopterin-dependent oxidoreductase [Sedimentibacter sp.]|uniref:molybdopterin-dependent oxidoreductase n=1 Tax=Sedimentibacter sp. TaxID=1960295 RepID=UPI0031580289